MAGLKKLEVLEQLLECPACHHPYSNPKMLQCFHVSCQKCLEELVNQGEAGNDTLTCPTPTCGMVMPVPATGVASFQAAYRTTELQELHKALVEVDYCLTHKEREAELYCETWGTDLPEMCLQGW
jgi:hypothetical protein